MEVMAQIKSITKKEEMTRVEEIIGVDANLVIYVAC